MIENIKADNDIYDERITKEYEPITMDKIVKLNCKIKKGIME